MTDSEVLLNKEGLQFARVKEKHYTLTFSMENMHIILSNIIDFNLIKLIYDLNSDIYEKVILDKINDDEAVATLLMKHFFEDLGLPQRFSFLHIKKIVEERRIIFVSQSIRSHKPEGMPEDAELMAINDLTSICNIVTPHKINFSFNIVFDPIMNIPPFAEKMVGLILFKIFKRVKQFIENVRL
jgi:hypothetical protein